MEDNKTINSMENTVEAKPLRHLITALATPYVNGKIDYYGYERLITAQVASNVDALLVCGTTAEAALLDERETKLLFMLAKATAKYTPIIMGVGGASTKEVAKKALYAAKMGAYAILLAPPPFSKCTMTGFESHVMTVKRAANIPVILYNAPNRCNYTLEIPTVKSLARMGVRSIKDAGSDIVYTEELSKFSTVLCGNDEKLKEFTDCGAKGVISVVSNVAPILTRKVLEGKANQSEYDYFVTLAKMSMREVSPIAIKYMLYKKQIFDNYEMRLPLTDANMDTRAQIDEIWIDELTV